MFDLVNNEFHSKELLIKSCNSTISLWNKDKKSFIRNLYSTDAFYPTATLHGLSALLDCGLFLDKKPIHFEEINSTNIPTLEDISSIFSENKWVDEMLKKSTHTSNKQINGEGTTEIYNIRIAIVLERLLSVLDSLSDLKIDTKFINKGHDRIYQIISEFLTDKDNAELFPEPGVSPLPTLNLVLCINYYNSIARKLGKPIQFDEYKDKFLKLVMGHINYHMARFNGSNEPSFDPISLATALYAASVLSPELKYTSFFNSCLQVIIDNQSSNGCWPSGVSISFSENGDVVQLPSVEIAIFIAESAIDENILINYNENIKQTLNIILPAFRKFAKHLEITFQNNKLINNKLISGWISDRIGRREFIETWITAQANRFLYKYWLAEKALLRNLSLEKLGLKEFKAKSLTIESSLGLWEGNIIEPDHITAPTTTILNSYIHPILKQKKAKTFIYYPAKDKMSFIIFGPPGSGKTFFIEQMAKCLDWPLVELSPGHFIKNGIELIESTTKEIFDLLNNINHAIVFFDECDELFRSRDSNQSSTRTILSFATASMLPKLQKLHDKNQIILVLGTNYLQNIDQAIRRPGRFDDIFMIDRPDKQSRLKHVRNYLKAKGISKTDEDINKFVEITEFYTIKELLKSCKSFNPLSENTVLDYKDWCFKDGENELKNSRYSKPIQKEIIERWGIADMNHEPTE